MVSGCIVLQEESPRKIRMSVRDCMQDRFRISIPQIWNFVGDEHTGGREIQQLWLHGATLLSPRLL